jgi:hypothetical protein
MRNNGWKNCEYFAIHAPPHLFNKIDWLLRISRFGSIFLLYPHRRFRTNAQVVIARGSYHGFPSKQPVDASMLPHSVLDFAWRRLPDAELSEQKMRFSDNLEFSV